MSPNPLVAGTLFKSKDIEKWGSGLKRIANECAENSVKVEFKILKSGFLVTFYRRPPRDLSPITGEKMLALIQQYPKITTGELAARTGLTVKGIDWNIRLLKEQGVLKRVGPDKGGHWEAL